MPHYAKNKAVGVMKPGHVFTIEPMINEGVWGDQTWPDNWTSVTQVVWDIIMEHRFQYDSKSGQFEDLC